MLHMLYLLAFTILAFLAISNMIRSLVTLSADSGRRYPPAMESRFIASGTQPHPELLDDSGNVINEPLLVMRSITVEDAREQLEALFNNPPENSSP